MVKHLPKKQGDSFSVTSTFITVILLTCACNFGNIFTTFFHTLSVLLSPKPSVYDQPGHFKMTTIYKTHL